MTNREVASLGILHPGSMGAAVAAQARQNGAEVVWCSAGRSPATRQRAAAAGLEDVGNIQAMAERCDVVMSLCPPAFAAQVAADVQAAGFDGVYVDANPVSPDTLTAMSQDHPGGPEHLVDGAVVGSPPSGTKRARLYLSGPIGPTAQVAALFDGTAVDVRVLEGGIGKASALKLAYSSYQKASRVLAAVAYAAAHDWGVEAELLDIADLRTANYLSETEYIPKTLARSWRWAPEMAEVASFLAGQSLPTELAEAAAEIMQRWGNVGERPTELPEVLEGLHQSA